MLNYGQQFAVDAMKTGRNIFLTGDGGTGKTYTINEYIRDAESKGKNVLMTAPTGIAALNIDGVTLHRGFCVPIGVLVDNPSQKNLTKEVLNADIIFIEEISMCRIDLFDYVAKIIMMANNTRKYVYHKPEIQLIVSGDFLQLPPVITERDTEALDGFYGRHIRHGFAFESEYWKEFNFFNINLSQPMRQADTAFINTLRGLRIGDYRYLRNVRQMASRKYMDNAITLCGTNRVAKEKNDYELDMLTTPLNEYVADIDGDVKASDKVTEDVLELKVGARIMTLVNDSADRYKSGSFGTVEKLETNRVTVKMDNGCVVPLERYTWEIKKYTYDKTTNKVKKDVVGRFTQFPLKLAWAITIHKSQGQTYDEVNLNPYCWDCGQLYVALSRVKDISKLYLMQPLLDKYLVTSKEVIDFYRNLRND